MRNCSTVQYAEPCGETYLDVAPELRRAVNKHARGGDRDEYLSAANLSFLTAYLKYNQSRGDFRHWLRFRLKKDLSSVKRPPARPEVDLDSIPVDDPPRFDRDELIARLSRDGAELIRLVLSPSRRFPKDVVGLRAAVKRHLRKTGWSAGRVVRTFNEVRGKL